MASIVLKTFKGGNVTPQNDAIIYQTAIPGAGIFKGCEVTAARGNILHLSQGYGIIKGRFFEMYENEVSVQLAETGHTLNGQIYLHMDLSNADEPIKIIAETGETLTTLMMDANVNYNNSTYDLQLAVFKVTAAAVTDLTQTFPSVQGATGGGGAGGGGLTRDTAYEVGDVVTCANAPGWCFLVCTQRGATAIAEPIGYTQITKSGDIVLDGTAVFTARDVMGELAQSLEAVGNLESKHDEDIESLTEAIEANSEAIEAMKSDSGALVQKIMSVSQYNGLGTYDPNTMYFCYENADTHEIKRIYLGQHVIYASGVSVTYKVDTNQTITQTAALAEDIVRSAPAVTKSGYTFVGWKSDNTADGAVLSNYVLQSASAVTLYAVFKKNITIEMDSGDAELMEDAEETSQTAILYYNNGTSLSEPVVMPENVYTLGEGKSFIGWKTSLASEVIYIPRESYSFTKDEMLVPAFVDTEYDFVNVSTQYQTFHVPADGIYEFELWGGAGGTAMGTIDNETVYGKGGKGGHVKAYRKCKRGSYLYVYNGGKGKGNTNTTSSYSVSGGLNGGGNGYSYYSSNANKAWGAGGGGATYVADQQFSLNSSNYSTQYNQRQHILIIAGGGGGGGVSAIDSGTNEIQNYNFHKGTHEGGYGGGERGADGSAGVLGGRQIAVGTTDYEGFGAAKQTSGSNMTYSGGGAGWFSGASGSYGNSAAGGSSYVGNMPTFTYNGKKYKTLNEGNKNDGEGHAFIRFMEPCVVE